MLRAREGFDGPALYRFKRIRNYKSVIDPDRIAKTLTCRAGTVGRIEAEKSRLGFVVTGVVIFTDVRIRILELPAIDRFDHRGVGFAKAHLERIDETLAGFGRRRQAVDQNEGSVEIIELVIFGPIQFDRFTAAVEPGKSLL